MLKNLLYLYNDGHNPFPKLGKGGLGYHLPQYKQTIKGGTLELDENGEPYKFDNLNDNFFVIGPDGTVIGTYNVDPTDNFLELKLIKDDEVTLSTTSSPNIESKVIPKPQTNAKYIDDSNEFGEKYNYDLYVSDTPDDYKVSQVEPRLNKYYDVMRFTNRELDEQIDKLIKRAPVLFDSTEYRKSNFKNTEEKRNALINMQTLIEALSEVPTDAYDEIIEKHKKAKAEQEEIDAQEPELNEEEYSQLIFDMKEEVKQISRNKKKGYGVAFEDYLIEPENNYILKDPSVDFTSSLSSKFPILNQMKSTGKLLKDYIVYDLYSLFTLYEIKNFGMDTQNFKALSYNEILNSNSPFIEIQCSKFEGNYSFLPSFVSYNDGTFKLYNIKCKENDEYILPTNDKGGRDLKFVVLLKDGVYECNPIDAFDIKFLSQKNDKGEDQFVKDSQGNNIGQLYVADKQQPFKRIFKQGQYFYQLDITKFKLNKLLKQ